MNHRRIILVMDEDIPEGVLQSESSHPIWIVCSTTNDGVVERLRCRDTSSDITTFSLRPGERAESACARIVDSLDQHFNQSAQTEAYRELKVIGVSVDATIRTALAGVGLGRLKTTSDGFCAFRDHYE